MVLARTLRRVSENKVNCGRVANKFRLGLPASFIIFDTVCIPIMALPPKDSDVQLDFEELGLAQDAPPLPSLCGVPLKFIS